MKNLHDKLVWRVTGALQRGGISAHVYGANDLIRIDCQQVGSLLACQLIEVGTRYLTCVSLMKKSCPPEQVRNMAELVCRINNRTFRTGWMRLVCHSGEIIFEQDYAYKVKQITPKRVQRMLQDGRRFFETFACPIIAVADDLAEPRKALQSNVFCDDPLQIDPA